MTPALNLPASVENRACFQQFMGGLCIESSAFDALVSQIGAVGMDKIWEVNEKTPQSIFSRGIYSLAASMRIAGMDAHLASVASDEDGGDVPPYVISKGTAIIPVNGPLSKQPSSLQGMFGGSSTIGMRKALALALADDAVQRVMFHIDSSGGTVAGTGEIGDDIYSASSKKPIASYIEDMGTSAAYWIASQAAHVYASPYSMTGSIGVIWTVYDRSEAAAKAGIKVHAITSSPGKAYAVDGMPITPKQLAKMQATVDGLYENFLQAVARGRGVSRDDARVMSGDADIYGADAALSKGLIDTVSTFGQALADFAATPPQSMLRTAWTQPKKRRTTNYAVAKALTSDALSYTVANPLVSTTTATIYLNTDDTSGFTDFTGNLLVDAQDGSISTHSTLVGSEESFVTPDPQTPAGKSAAAPVTLSHEDFQALVQKADAGVEAKNMILALHEKQRKAEATTLESERERLVAAYPAISKDAVAACPDAASLRALETVARAGSNAQRAGADPLKTDKSSFEAHSKTLDSERDAWLKNIAIKGV